MAGERELRSVVPDVRLAGDSLLSTVSRPFLITLLEAAKIPFRMVGTRRRIRFSDLLDYQKKEQAEAKDLLDELATEAQKHKVGY